MSFATSCELLDIVDCQDEFEIRFGGNSNVLILKDGVPIGESAVVTYTKYRCDGSTTPITSNIQTSYFHESGAWSSEVTMYLKHHIDYIEITVKVRGEVQTKQYDKDNVTEGQMHYDYFVFNVKD